MKNKIIFNIGIILSLAISFTDINAQANFLLDSTNMKVDPGISNSMVKTIYGTLEKAVREYSQASNLFDPVSKSMSNDAINRFVSMFDPEHAMIVKDYLKDPQFTPVSVNDYYFEFSESEAAKTGIQSTITEASVKAMSLSEKDRTLIQSQVLVSRKYENYIRDGKLEYYRPAQSKQLLITFTTPTFYTEEALITSISYFESKPEKAPVVANTKLAENTSDCNLIDGNTILPSGVNEDTLRLIEQLICNALEKYITAATFLDNSGAGVTGTTASKFQQLFTSGSSLHLSDYREYPENIPVSDYREDVFKFFKHTGIRFEIADPHIENISYDPDGFYYVDLSMSKSVPGYLDDRTYEIKQSGKKREFNLNLKYIIVRRVMNDPLIESAISDEIIKPEEKRTLITFSPDINLPFVNGTPVEGFSSITSNTTLGGSPGPGFQIELMSNFASKYKSLRKPLFLTIGLGVKTFSVNADLAGFIDSGVDSTIDMRYGLETARIDALEDRLPFTSLTLPVGISYRLVQSGTKNFELFIGGKLVPTYILESEGLFDVKGFYNLNYEDLGFSLYDESGEFHLNPNNESEIQSHYHVGDLNETDGSVPGFASKFTLGYKLETSFLAALSARFMLFGRISYDGFFGTAIDSELRSPNDPTLVQTLEPQQQILRSKNLLQEYYSSTKIAFISLGIGLAYRL